jgi:hypothetical protein
MSMRVCFILGLAILLLMYLFGWIGCSSRYDGMNLPCEKYGDEFPFPESLDYPEIREALETQKRTEEYRIRLVSVTSEIDDAVADTVDAIPHDLADELAIPHSATIRELAETTARLRVAGHEILDRKDEYLKAFKDYQDSAETAPDQLRRAAQLFFDFSEQETFDDLRQDYREMGEMLNSLADHYEGQLANLGRDLSIGDFIATTAFLERAVLMLDRFEAGLAVALSVHDFVQANKYLKKLHEFIREFESFRIRIRRANQELKESKPPTTSTGGKVANREDESSFFPIAKTEFALCELSS